MCRLYFVFCSCYTIWLRTKGPRNQAFVLSSPAFTGTQNPSCVHSFFLPDRPTHLNEREGGGKRNILLGWHEESAEETITVLVVENSNGGKLRIVRADGPLPISGYYFLYPGDLQDGTRVCMVFRNGIKTGRSNIVTWKNGICFGAMSLTLRLRHKW